jgi:hypothetical protein
LITGPVGGLQGRRHSADEAGDHPVVVEDHENRIVVSPRLWVGQEGHLVAAVPDDQIPSETTVDTPTGAGEALFYLISVHSLTLPANASSSS